MNEMLKWPFAETTDLEPSPKYAEIRKCPHAPKVSLWDGKEAWLFTRFEDVRTAFRHPAMSSDSSADAFPTPDAATAAARKGQKSFIRMDPPQHDVHRMMLAKDFANAKVLTYKPYIEGLVDRLLEAMEKQGGPVDFVAAFAHPIPSTLTCVLLDLPESDAPFFSNRINVWGSVDSTPQEASQAAQDIIDYFDKLVTARESALGEDLVSKLIVEQLREGKLTKTELVWMLQTLLAGGFDTTANMITLGTLLLLDHPEQRDDLVAHPDLVNGAVEEMLRYLSVVQFTAVRLATGDAQIGATCVHAGEGVVAPLEAANHDPERFPDPHKFDVRRDARGHLAFGFGVHQCLGQQLARLELQIVFSKLFQRFPRLKLAVPRDRLTFKNAIIYGVKELPVIW